VSQRVWFYPKRVKRIVRVLMVLYFGIGIYALVLGEFSGNIAFFKGVNQLFLNAPGVRVRGVRGLWC
jgi:hypothetical protein